MRRVSQVLVSFLILLPSIVLAQGLVTGRVIDSETKKAINQATVTIDGGPDQSVTNSLGYFQINADTSDHLIIEKIGYVTGTVKVPQVMKFQIQLLRDKTPDFKGGMQEFYRNLAENLRYPSSARSSGTQGWVYASFYLDSIQGMQNISITRDIGGKCGQEVVRVLLASPNNWIPKVRSVRLILPVLFRGMSGGQFPQPEIQSTEGILLREIIVTAPIK